MIAYTSNAYGHFNLQENPWKDIIFVSEILERSEGSSVNFHTDLDLEIICITVVNSSQQQNNKIKGNSNTLSHCNNYITAAIPNDSYIVPITVEL